MTEIIIVMRDNYLFKVDLVFIIIAKKDINRYKDNNLAGAIFLYVSTSYLNFFAGIFGAENP